MKIREYPCSLGLAIDCWKVVKRSGTGGHAPVCEACKKKRQQEYGIMWARRKRHELSIQRNKGKLAETKQGQSECTETRIAEREKEC